MLSAEITSAEDSPEEQERKITILLKKLSKFSCQFYKIFMRYNCSCDLYQHQSRYDLKIICENTKMKN